MIRHYLKITIRDIGKNKLRYLITAAGIAVGMLLLSIVLYLVFTERFVGFSRFPGTNNIIVMQIFPNSDDTENSSQSIRSVNVNDYPEIIDLAQFSFTTSKRISLDEEPGSHSTVFYANTIGVEEHFFNILPFQFSAGGANGFTDKKVIISEDFALKLFGDKDALGKEIYLNPYDDTMQAFTVSGIVSYRTRSRLTADLYFPFLFTENTELSSAVAKLKQGTDKKRLYIRIVNDLEKLQSKSNEQAFIPPLINPIKKFESFIPNMTLQLLPALLGSLLLIVALINFFNLLMESVLKRIRQFTLRKVLGAGKKEIMIMLLCEIIPVLLGSVLLAYAFGEVLMFGINYYISDVIQIGVDLSIWFDLFRVVPLHVTGLVFLLSFLVIAILTRKIHRVILVQGIRGNFTKNPKTNIRDLFITSQLAITFFILVALATTFVSLQRSFDSGNTFHPFDKETRESILLFSLNDRHLSAHKEEIMQEIAAIPGVTETLNFYTANYFDYIKETITITGNQSLEIRRLNLDFSASAVSFFELPVDAETLSSLQAGDVIVNPLLGAELSKLNASGFENSDGNYHRVVGVAPLPYSKKDQFAMVRIVSNTVASNRYCVKTLPQKTKQVNEAIHSIVYQYLPKTLPFELRTLKSLTNQTESANYILMGIINIIFFSSLIIALLSTYSAVVTDTHYRRKEVALRKINGATFQTIARLFGKLYLKIVLLAAVAGSVLAVIIHYFATYIADSVLAGISTVEIILIFLLAMLILGGFVIAVTINQIRKVAKTNPAEVLQAE